MKWFFQIIVIAALGTTVTAQNNIYDLLTEPLVERPLTLHQGFLQTDLEYDHILGNNYFNSEGKRLDFKEVVRSMIEDNVDIRIGYGILEYLEFRSSITYRNRLESLPTYYVSNNMNYGVENTLFHYRGLGNLNSFIKVRTPVLANGLMLYGKAGISLPLSNQHPQKPEHTINILDPSDPGSTYELDYTYRPAPGYVSTFYIAGAGIKYRNSDIVLLLNGEYGSPIGEKQTYTWDFRLYDGEFEYLENEYRILENGWIYMNLQAAYQAFPWFAAYGGFSINMETPGWTYQTGQQVALSRATRGLVKAGFEIQVSTHLRMNQLILLPVLGKNTFAEFEVLTGISYTIGTRGNKP